MIIELFRIGKIKICAHWTFGVSLALISLYLVNYFSGGLPPSIKSGSLIFACVAISMILIYGSLLAHELAHSAVLSKHNSPVNLIIFFMLGATAIQEKDVNSPGAEFKTAIAGPLASIIIAGAAYGLSFAAAAYGMSNYNPLGDVSNQAKYAPLLQILGVVYHINFVIAIFNLIPAFPMDGGRVLRAGLWRLTENKIKATAISAYLACFIGGIGMLSPLFFGLRTIFVALIGYFIIKASLRALEDLKFETIIKNPPDGIKRLDRNENKN